MIEFSFETIHTQRGTTLRPKAVVRLIGPSAFLHVDCLVDSGADTSVITWEVGQYLGLTVEASENPYSLGGISGSLPCYLRSIEMEIGTIRFKGTVMWALSDDLPNILGREDVFDRFDIEFKQCDRSVFFRPRSVDV